MVQTAHWRSTWILLLVYVQIMVRVTFNKPHRSLPTTRLHRATVLLNSTVPITHLFIHSGLMPSLLFSFHQVISANSHTAGVCLPALAPLIGTIKQHVFDSLLTNNYNRIDRTIAMVLVWTDTAHQTVTLAKVHVSSISRFSFIRWHVDVNECQSDPSRCDHGVCINLLGSFTCNCMSGYRFHNQTCIGIFVDHLLLYCSVHIHSWWIVVLKISTNVVSRTSMVVFLVVVLMSKNAPTLMVASRVHAVQCSIQVELVFVSTHLDNISRAMPWARVCFVLLDNESLCVNDTCTDAESGRVLCLHGSVNVNNTCVRE